MGFLTHFLSYFDFERSRTTHDISFDLTEASPLRPAPTYPTLRPSTIRLPQEIILSIIEIASYNGDLQRNDSLLNTCSLLCKDLNFPIQRLLFNTVTLSKQSAFSAFEKAVDRSTEPGRALGDAVVRMDIVVDYNQPLGLTQQSFSRAVTLCPNLYELKLSLYGCGAPGQDVVGAPDVSRMQRLAPSFDDTTLTLLRSGPAITALQFNNWSENRQSVVQLLDVWPTLQSLAIGGTPPDPPSTSSPAFPSALRELRMNFQHAPSLDFMKWLLHNSSSTLHALELERQPSLPLLQYLIDFHGSTIQALSLPRCSSFEEVDAVQRCTQLREIKFEDAWTSPMMFRKMPQDIRHLAIGLDSHTALSPVLAAVKARACLKALTIQVWGAGETHPQLGMLRELCAERGVECHLTRDVGLFRTMARAHTLL